MRKLLVVWCWILNLQVMAQQPVCLEAISDIQTDSLVMFVKNITGKQPVLINDTLQVIASRHVSHPGNNLAAAYLKQTVLHYGWSVEDIPFSSTGRNIIAYKPGTVNPKQAYLIGAHYDCVGNASMNFEGADDNASGVAALLETARVLRAATFPYTIILAFWDEEEIGLLGSMAFAPDGPKGYWDIEASINLDMIGYDGNKDSLAMVHTIHTGYSETLADKMVEVNRIYNTGLNMEIKNPGDKATDHQSFWLKGATAVGLTEDYDNDFSPNWHQLSDSLGNMDLPYFSQMSHLACAAICEISQTGNYVAVPELRPVQLTIYPNPAQYELQLPTTINWNNTKVHLYNYTGVELTSHGIENARINISDLQTGVYWMLIETEKETYRIRFVRK